MSENWQPIEGAPKGGTAVIVAVPPERTFVKSWIVGEARYLGDESGWWWANNDPSDHWGQVISPTHWQPLPAPPEQQSLDPALPETGKP